MSKQENALDRLERTKVPSNEREFTLEEQLDSVSTDDFLDGMSDVAKDNLGHLFTEVTTDENTETEVEVEPEIKAESEKPTINNYGTATDELFNNNNTKPKRRSKKNQDDSNMSSQGSNNPSTNMSNPVLDQLSKDIIDELRNRQLKINRFDDKSMEMIFDYMYSKF